MRGAVSPSRLLFGAVSVMVAFPNVTFAADDIVHLDDVIVGAKYCIDKKNSYVGLGLITGVKEPLFLVSVWDDTDIFPLQPEYQNPQVALKERTFNKALALLQKRKIVEEEEAENCEEILKSYDLILVPFVGDPRVLFQIDEGPIGKWGGLDSKGRDLLIGGEIVSSAERATLRIVIDAGDGCQSMLASVIWDSIDDLIAWHATVPIAVPLTQCPKPLLKEPCRATRPLSSLKEGWIDIECSVAVLGGKIVATLAYPIWDTIDEITSIWDSIDEIYKNPFVWKGVLSCDGGFGFDTLIGSGGRFVFVPESLEFIGVNVDDAGPAL